MFECQCCYTAIASAAHCCAAFAAIAVGGGGGGGGGCVDNANNCALAANESVVFLPSFYDTVLI